MVVLTWNVLHRIHAVNWDEGALANHADEHARIASIAAWIARCGADVVCLQEVSGDQLAALGDRAIATKYPRVPRYYRRFEPETLREPAEYLVTIVRDGRFVHGEAFASDPGKGVQIVEVAGMRIANTHVSYGDRRAAQCVAILDALGDGPAVICGDFNADRATCSERLPGFTAAIPREPALPTRPRTMPSEKSQAIDHVFVRGALVEASEVLDGGGLSDHNPVRATIQSR